MAVNPKVGSDLRQHPRVPMALKVEITLEDSGVLFAKTRDISEGGVFLMLEQDQMPQLGDIVKAQIKDLPGQSETPVVPMRVVRIAADGIGLMVQDAAAESD